MKTKSTLALAGLLVMGLMFGFKPANALIAVGSKMPDIVVHTTKGATLNLGTQHGYVVLLDFWATWCPPCRMETPHLQDLYKKYGKDKVKVIGVSMGEGKEAPEKFAQENKLTYIIGYTSQKEASEIASKIQFEGIPTTLIIDKEGIIRYADSGFGEGMQNKFDKTISEYLKKK
jgi:peroxiredoxin